jgi:hypothetical protein
MAVPAPEPGAAEVAETVSSRLPKMIAAAFFVLSFAISSLLGFVFGGKALGDIRESGGRKRGLGFACFGTLAWPVVVLLFLASLPMALAPAGGGVSINWLIMFPLFLISGILAAFMLVRGVARWAGGVEDKDGVRRHPGFGWSLLRSVLLAILLPTLGILLATALAKGDENHGEGRGGPRSDNPTYSSSDSRNNTPPSPGPEVRWRSGSPELTLPLVLKPDQKLAFRVFLLQPNGDTLHVAGMEEVIPRPGFLREHVLRVGTELYGTTHRLVVTKSGFGSLLARTLEDFRDHDFNESLPEELAFDSPGRYEFELASHSVEGQDTPDRVLMLEVVVSE